MKNILYTFIVLLVINISVYSQSVGISDIGGTTDSNAILDLRSDDKGFLPPRMKLDDVTKSAPLSSVIEGMIIYNEGGTEDEGLYLWTGSEWTMLNNQSVGGGGSSHYLGELFGGGIIYWLDQTGNHGLIAGLYDLDLTFGTPLSATTNSFAGAFDHYDGASNTALLVAQDGTAGYAATLCNSYSGGGYNDWYLPSNYELALLLHARDVLYRVLANDGDPATHELLLVLQDPGQPRDYYWSSTEVDIDPSYAYYTRLRYNTIESKDKSYGCRVRPVRAF